MKNPSKLRLFFFTAVVMAFVGYYLTQNNCRPFQTTFLEKEIVFPITVKAVAKKYNLLYDSVAIRGMPSGEKDTLLIVDSKENSPDAYAMVFYLRGISPKKIGMIKNQLEKKFGATFKKNRIPTSFQFMKIHDCVYVLVDINKYGSNEVFKSFSSDTITCRVGFYYGLSESELISTSADGHPGIIGKGHEPLAY